MFFGFFFRNAKWTAEKKKSIELVNLVLTHQTKTHAHKKDIFKIAHLSDSIIKTPARCASDRRQSATQKPQGQQVRVCLSSPPAVAPLAFRRPTSACSGHGITWPPHSTRITAAITPNQAARCTWRPSLLIHPWGLLGFAFSCPILAA